MVVPGTSGTGLGIGEPITWVVGSGGWLIMTIGLASTETATDVTKLTPMSGMRALVNQKEFGAVDWEEVLNIASPGKIGKLIKVTEENARNLVPNPGANWEKR